MGQNIKDLYDFVGSLDKYYFNTDLSDVPQTGEKIEINDAFTKEWAIRQKAAKNIGQTAFEGQN